MKTKLAIASVVVIGSAGILVAAPWKKKGDSGKEKNKKYQVISMQDGKLVEYDTIIPMSSTYTVDQFLADKNIENDDVEIIKIPSAGEIEMEFFDKDDIDSDKKKKVVVKTEIKTDKDFKTDGKNVKEENVQITCTIDDNGKMVAKKIVNGKEVEMTQEEIDKMMKMHMQHGKSKDGKHENVMIKIDVDDKDMGELHEDIIKKVHEELKDLDIDINIGEHLNIDSLIDAVHKNIDIDVDGENVKVIVKKLDTEGSDKDHEHVVIIEDGEKVEWNSKDGAHVEILSDGGSHEDFTIVIVTEDIDEQPSRKTINASNEDFKVFPNPNNGEFTLQMNFDEKSKVKIEVTDLQGKTVLSKDLGKVSGTVNEKINLTEKGAGVYMINIYSGKTKTTQKVIVR